MNVVTGCCETNVVSKSYSYMEVSRPTYYVF